MFDFVGNTTTLAVRTPQHSMWQMQGIVEKVLYNTLFFIDVFAHQVVSIIPLMLAVTSVCCLLLLYLVV